MRLSSFIYTHTYKHVKQTWYFKISYILVDFSLCNFGAKLLDLLDTHRFKRLLSSWSVVTMELPGGSQATKLEDLLGATFLSKKKHFFSISPQSPTPPLERRLLLSRGSWGTLAREEELTLRTWRHTEGAPPRRKSRWGPRGGTGNATYRNLCY